MSICKAFVYMILLAFVAMVLVFDIIITLFSLSPSGCDLRIAGMNTSSICNAYGKRL